MKNSDLVLTIIRNNASFIKVKSEIQISDGSIYMKIIFFFNN
jgi:hypothetical protein